MPIWCPCMKPKNVKMAPARQTGAFHEVAIDYANGHRAEDQSAENRAASEDFETPVGTP